MRKRVNFFIIALGALFITRPMLADDWGDAFRKAEDLVHNQKPSSSGQSERTRDNRGDDSARKGERERQRIEDEAAEARRRAREEAIEAKRREQERIVF